MKNKGLKDKILNLFKKKKSYNEIKKILKCSKGTISYYCSELRPIDKRYSDENINKYQKYYDTYGNLSQTASYFGLSKSTLKNKLTIKPRKILTVKERKQRNKRLVCDYRRRIKIDAIEYKGGKCENCGYKRSIYSLTFHHINPKIKDFGIGGKILKWEKIKKELNKCVLVCGNCHGEIHEQIYLTGESKIINKIINKGA